MFKRNIQRRSCNHYCSGKPILVALVMQHEKRMRHVVVYGLSGSKIFFHPISKTERLSGPRGGGGGF